MKLNLALVALILPQVSLARSLRGESKQGRQLATDGGPGESKASSFSSSENSRSQKQARSEFRFYPFHGIQPNDSKSKNVILVIGDGMGWEAIRAGAIAKSIINELENDFDCVVSQGGCPENESAKQAFEARQLQDYYTEGRGSGLCFQDDTHGFALVTNAGVAPQGPNPGDYVCAL